MDSYLTKFSFLIFLLIFFFFTKLSVISFINTFGMMLRNVSQLLIFFSFLNIGDYGARGLVYSAALTDPTSVFDDFKHKWECCITLP